MIIAAINTVALFWQKLFCITCFCQGFL